MSINIFHKFNIDNDSIDAENSIFKPNKDATLTVDSSTCTVSSNTIYSSPGIRTKDWYTLKANTNYEIRVFGYRTDSAVKPFLWVMNDSNERLTTDYTYLTVANSNSLVIEAFTSNSTSEDVIFGILFNEPRIGHEFYINYIEFVEKTTYNTNSILTIPSGGTTDRPTDPSTGIIRYNSTLSQFEGYNGTSWNNLGGQVTYDQTFDSTDNVSFANITGTGIMTITNTLQSTGTTDGSLVLSGGTGIAKNCNVGGNLIVTGNAIIDGGTTTIESSTLNVDDSLIILSKDNEADLSDIGLLGKYKTGANYRYSGLARDATDSGKWKLITALNHNPNTQNIIDFTLGSIADLEVADLTNTTLTCTNLTFDGTDLDLTGNISITGTLDFDGGQTITSISTDGTFADNSDSIIPTMKAVKTYADANVGLGSFVQQGSKLVGTGATGTATQGTSVALSSDGNTLAIGGHTDDTNTGAMWIFTRTGSTWTQQGSKLVGTGSVGISYQGWSSALSDDGNTLAVGGYSDNSSNGAVWIFTRSGSTWTQQGSKLVGTGGVGSARQGYSVSLSSNGNTLAVGGRTDNTGIGTTWIFTRSGSTWTQQGSKLVGTGSVGVTIYQGTSVSLSDDGNTLAIGGPVDNSQIGATWIFTRSGSTWTQQGSKLVGTGGSGIQWQGHSVALSSDGNILAIGGYTDNSNVGAIWIFTRSGSTWTQQGSKLVGTGGVGTQNQGSAVALNLNGNILAVGGKIDNSNVGATWIFTESDGTWTQHESKLVGTGYVVNTYQGISVALSDNGKILTFGGYGDNTNVGATWVFTA